MDSVQTCAWGITLTRKLVLLDLDTGGRNAFPLPVPGVQAILAADPFDGPKVLLASGEMLRLSARGWFREEVLGEAAEATT